jgi:hypothetical protein
VSASLRRVRCIKLRTVIPGHAASAHFAGTLPMQTRDEPLTTDRDGKLRGTQRVYVVDVEAGESLPTTAQLQLDDVAASSVSSPAVLAPKYADLANRDVTPAQKELYRTAARAALGDAIYQNGHGSDALWLYQQGN